VITPPDDRCISRNGKRSRRQGYYVPKPRFLAYGNGEEIKVNAFETELNKQMVPEMYERMVVVELRTMRRFLQP